MGEGCAPVVRRYRTVGDVLDVGHRYATWAWGRCLRGECRRYRRLIFCPLCGQPASFPSDLLLESLNVRNAQPELLETARLFDAGDGLRPQIQRRSVCAG